MTETAPAPKRRQRLDHVLARLDLSTRLPPRLHESYVDIRTDERIVPLPTAGIASYGPPRVVSGERQPIGAAAKVVATVVVTRQCKKGSA